MSNTRGGRKWNTIVRIWLVGLTASAPAEAWATFVPPDLPVGAVYQLLFVTAGDIDPNSSDIDVYNAFAKTQAAQNPDLPQTNWHAVVSTTAVNAIDNAPSTPGIPVYNTHGIELSIADGAASIYQISSINAPVSGDQFGDSRLVSVWTGSWNTGVAYFPLGDESQSIYSCGISSLETDWLNAAASGAKVPGAIYVLSDPIIVPEPAALTLLAAGALGLAIVALGSRKSQRAG